MNNKQKILNRIASRIGSEKPIDSLLIRSMRLGVIAACGTLLMVAIVLIGLFIFDLLEKNTVEGFFGQNIYTPANFLFEYLIFAVILILFFVYLYRRFDWPLVKQKNMIFGIGLATSVIIGIGVAYGAEHIFPLRHGLNTVKDAYVTTMPVRSAQIATTHTLLTSSNNVVGSISKMVENGEEITISLHVKNTEETYILKESEVTEKLRVGEKIAAHIDTDGKTITRLKIVK